MHRLQAVKETSGFILTFDCISKFRDCWFTMRNMVKPVGSVLTMSGRKLTHNYGCPRFSAREREAKEERGKKQALSVKEKSTNSRFFLPLPHYTGNPVQEPKAARQGKSRVLNKVCVTYKYFFSVIVS
jgi:hypothetical protein